MAEFITRLLWRHSGGGQLTWYIETQLCLLSDANKHDLELSGIPRTDSREEAMEQHPHTAAQAEQWSVAKF